MISNICIDLIQPVVASITNTFITKGEVHIELTEANVIPIHKSGNRDLTLLSTDQT